MAKPWLRKETGVYYLRVKIPVDLVKHLGKTTEKISLNTKDHAVAKQRFDARLAEVRERWKSVERYRELTLIEANAIGHDIYLAKREHFRAGKFQFFGEMYGGIVLNRFVNSSGEPQAEAYAQFRQFYGKHIQAYLDKRGIRLDGPNRRVLDFAIANALLQAMGEDLKNLDGDFSADPNIGRFPPIDVVDLPTSLSIVDSFEQYAEFRKLAPSTVKRWRGVIRGLVEFLGHDDIVRVTKRDLVRWTELLLLSKNPATVSDVHLASVRALLRWLVDNDKLMLNPTRGITIRVPERILKRDKEFTDEEVQIILAASLQPQRNISATMAAAIRWIPWICAYTGARVNEITQLRVEDIQERQNVDVFHITPEAGTTKNKKRRYIPIHEHLKQQGFLEFVARKKSGPIFYEMPKRGKTKTDAPYHKTGEKVASWVRSLGITDTEVMPNHAWRHLFKTLGRTVRMSNQVLDALQGHAPRTEGEAYGTWRMETLSEEMSKLPRFQIAHEAPEVVPGINDGP